MSAFRTISEVADELDVPKHVLRFWEGKFSQLRPMKRGGGRRYYRPEDVDLLRGIRWLLYSDGYTIKGVQRILRDSGVRFVKGCWRDGDADDEISGQDKLMDIPDLAEETRRSRDMSARSGPARGSRTDGESTSRESAPGDPHLQMLNALLRDLEDCRNQLKAAANNE